MGRFAKSLDFKCIVSEHRLSSGVELHCVVAIVGSLCVVILLCNLGNFLRERERERALLS